MIMLHKGKAVKDQVMGRINGWLAEPLDELEVVPPLHYTGTKIPERLWERIKSFLIWSQQQFNSEAQLRLFYNDQQNRWRALAMPQYIDTGLFSAEIKAHADRAKIYALVPEKTGWKEFGSVHHHCNAGAFQSGTDHKDEIDRPGVHITLGHVEAEILDMHCRAVFRGICYPTPFEDWVEGDLNTSTATFPKIWAVQCHEKPKPVTYSTHNKQYENTIGFDQFGQEQIQSPYSVWNGQEGEELDLNSRSSYGMSETIEALFDNWVYEVFNDCCTASEDFIRLKPEFKEDLIWAQSVLKFAAINAPAIYRSGTAFTGGLELTEFANLLQTIVDSAETPTALDELIAELHATK